MSAPPRSPRNQVSQTTSIREDSARPPAQRLNKPTLALIAVAGTMRAAKRMTPCGRSNEALPAANRFTSSAPITASRVFPIAIPAEVATAPVVVRFTRNAPSAMAGQIRRPKRRAAATAIPLGTQNGLALALTEARARPSLPARK